MVTISNTPPWNVKLHIPPRRSVSAPVGKCTLYVNGDRITIDEQNMDGRLYRLLPHGYAHTTLADWLPFISLAYAMGVMR